MQEAFTRPIKPAHTGEETDVPPTCSVLWSYTM
jgi:hypothetical protein